MRSKKQKEKKNNLKVAIVFIGIIVLLVVFSLLVRFIIAFNSSKFDGESPLSIEIDNGRSAGVLTLSPGDKKVSLIKVDNGGADVSDFLGIGAEAKIKSDSFLLSEEIRNEVFKLLIDYGGVRADLNAFYRIRIVFFVKSTHSDSIKEITISPSATSSQVDQIVSSLISDKKIIEEGLSIEVKNASGIDGLGTKIARVIANFGGNVILVSSSEDILDASYVGYSGRKTYTVKRLSKVFGMNSKNEKESSIADVLIIIGKDREE